MSSDKSGKPAKDDDDICIHEDVHAALLLHKSSWQSKRGTELDPDKTEQIAKILEPSDEKARKAPEKALKKAWEAYRSPGPRAGS